MVVALSASGTVAQAAFIQAPGSPYTTGHESYSVSPGLFNADPLTDLAVVNGTSSEVHVFNQLPGDAGFTLASGSPFAVGSGPNYAAVADYNADGRQDLAVANYSSSSISVELQQSNGTFSVEGAPISVAGNPGGIAGGDFNGDGRPDIAVAGFNNNTVQILLRKPDNSGFVAGTSFGAGGTNPRYVAAGDLDGANGPDLAITNSGSGTVSVFLNQPGGTFTAASGSPYAVGATPQFVVIAPLDGDTRPDLAVANYTDSTVTVLDHQPSGSFAPEAGSPFAVGTNPVGIAAADLRGTGRQDLVVAAAGSAAFNELDNTGTTFTRGPDTSTGAGTLPFGIATGQFNASDSRPDVAVSSLRSPAGELNYLSVFINHPPPRAATLDASGVSGTSATLNASVNPAGSDTDAHFEYGTTTAYGSLAPAGGELSAGADVVDHPISRLVQDLAPNTTYHFRVVASSVGGQVVGDDHTFTTLANAPPPPSALTGPPQAYLSAPSEVAVGTPTTLSAEGSTPAGNLTYRLDLDGSGQFATDLKTARSYQATFTSPGDVKVSLQVTDAAGRTDVVRRTVHVTQPPVFGLTYTPTNPKPGQTVRFTVGQLVDGPKSTARLTPLRDSLTTLSYGDGSKPAKLASGLLVTGRDASSTGSFTHVFDDTGTFKMHLGIDDLNGYQQSVDFPIAVGKKTDYTPVITTASTTVEQGSCVSFTDATAGDLAVDDVGKVIDEDINPVHKMIIVAPPTKVVPIGGEEVRLNTGTAFTTRIPGSVLNVSPLTNLQFASPSLNLNFGRAKTRQAEVEPTVINDYGQICELWQKLEAAAQFAADLKPYPPGGDAGWQTIPSSCLGVKPRTTYETRRFNVTPLTAQLQTTRHTWFSINRWDFGDGSPKTGPEAYLPSYAPYHPYTKGGTFTVRLSTTYPKDLAHQLDTWKSSCTTKPLDATKSGDSRFVTKDATLKLRVLAHYDRIRMRGMWMTSGAHTFVGSDIPGVYTSSGAIYVNTRRNGYAYNPNTGHPDPDPIDEAEGVLVVVPDDGPLQVVPDQGEIIGPAHLLWQFHGGRQIALGPMPTKVNGTPGIVIPTAGPGGTHDLGLFNDPPASLGSGLQGPGAAFHVNYAHPILREGKGGTLELNVHLPQPLGPGGAESDESIVLESQGTGRAVTRGLLDNFDIDIPAVELVPDVLSFDGGKLSHHIGQPVPWQATGSLDVFKIKVDMSPDTVNSACPVEGGLGFYEDGGLAKAGAALTGLKIPIPNPPFPPVTALASPSLEIVPATSHSPLDLFGCLSIQDYPTADQFQVTGCAGFLSAGAGGVLVPDGTKIPFCPNSKGGETFALTDHNSTREGSGRRLRGIVIRVSGTVFLGPTQFQVAQAYVEYRSDPLTVQAEGHIGLAIIPPHHLEISGDVFGYFRSGTSTEWAIGGTGGVVQDIICLPIAGCPGPTETLLISNHGLGACFEAFEVSIGGDINWDTGDINPHVPGCDMGALQHDLGVTGLRSALSRPSIGDSPMQGLAVPRDVQSGTVSFPGTAPYAMVAVRGADRAPTVQVRDPSGKLILDDTGAPVQGLSAGPPAPKPVNLATQDPEQPTPLLKKAPQGILHVDGNVYHDANIDFRNTTIVLIRKPKKGGYTITAKPGSAPITEISHANALATPQITATVATKGTKRSLSVKSSVAAGSTVTISEQGKTLNQPLTTVATAKAASATATIARTSRLVSFTPALGPAGKRNLVAVISRNGIPYQRMVVGSYVAPPPPRIGAVRGLKAKLKASKLTVTWRPATNAKRYVVTVTLRRHVKLTRSVSGKAHRLVVSEALARLGATVSVQAIGPLAVAGKVAKVRVAPVKVKRIKHFVL